MAALTASMVSCPTAPVVDKPFNGLSRTSLPLKAVPSFAQRTVSNGARTRQMLVWQPVNNKCAPCRPGPQTLLFLRLYVSKPCLRL